MRRWDELHPLCCSVFEESRLEVEVTNPNSDGIQVGSSAKAVPNEKRSE